MNPIKIALIREGKTPIDRRVPLNPLQAESLQNQFESVHVICQRSQERCFSEEEYNQHQISVVDEIKDCDILLGVKEVPVELLIPGKTYFFFSHTIKKQTYNRKLLQAILERKIRLIDYECLTDTAGIRIIAFGRYAGIVGTYNGIMAYGFRYNLFHLKRAKDCFDLEELRKEWAKVHLPKIKIVITGGGRVAKGAMEVLNGMGIRRISPEAFIQQNFDDAVYTQLNARDYNQHKAGKPFVRTDFYKNPENYQSSFMPFFKNADILISGAFWDPRAPVLFTREDILKRDFSIKIVADISCDLEGPIPSTKMASSIEDPFYDYNPSEDKLAAPFTDEGNITVMAVDNLPCELPRDASTDFGNDLLNRVLPHLLGDDSDGIIQRATIAENGRLSSPFEYLKDYVAGS